MKILFENLEKIISAPNGVKKVRELILQLAVQGKLVKQDPNDEPASELLKKIKLQKEKLFSEGEIRKKNELSEIKDDEKPFGLPRGWIWVRLGSVVNVKSSKRIYASDYQNQGIPFFRSKEIGDLSRKEEIKTILFISNQKYTQIKKEFGVPVRGDLLLTSVGSIGNSWISDGREFYYKDGNITQIDKNDLLNVDYLQKYISSPLFIRLVGGTVAGTAYNALTIIKINNLIFPLPPLNEQKRIVEKVNEVMSLCNDLEIKLNKKSMLAGRLTSAIVQTISSKS